MLRWQFSSATPQPAGGSAALDRTIVTLEAVNTIVDGFMAYSGEESWVAYQSSGIRSWARAIRYLEVYLLGVHGKAMVAQLPADKLARLGEAMNKSGVYFGGKLGTE